MEKKQTAVEWLVEEINKNGEEIHKNGNWIPTHMIEQAKEIENSQMKEMYVKGINSNKLSLTMGATLQGHSQNYEGATLSYDEAQKGSFNIMKKQTALQWYIQQCENIKYNPLEKNGYTIAKEKIIKQALEMEKEQIEIAFAKSYLTGCEEVSYNDANKASENYYNETYGDKI